MKILYLRHKQIDMVKWDRCITNAFNGNIYAYSWYLNIVCNTWDALIYDDYKAVFPLPIKKKFGFSWLYHPLLSGQLGIFSIDKLDSRLVNLFLERIPYKFKKINVKLNKFIKIEKCDYYITKHSTFVIDLIRNTTSIYSAYTPELRIIIDKALLQNLSVINALQPQQVIDFLFDEDTIVNKSIRNEQVSQLQKILACFVGSKLGSIYGVYSGVNNICALGIFLYSHNKISVPLLAVNSEGKEHNAIQLLLHTVIYNNIEQNITLAYEEANNKYFSNVFLSFGAEKKYYKEISKLRLVWPLNKLLS